MPNQINKQTNELDKLQNKLFIYQKKRAGIAVDKIVSLIESHVFVR